MTTTREAADPPGDDSGDRAAARRAQLAAELTATTARALCGDPTVRFRGPVLGPSRGGVALAAHLTARPDRDDPRCLRGVADGVGLRLQRSDTDLHAELRPTRPAAALVFDQLEQFRVESDVPTAMPGVAANLAHRFRHWSRTAHENGLTDTSVGLLLHTVAQVARSRLTGEPVLAETEDLMEPVRAGLAPVLGHGLDALRRHRGDQRAFAGHACRLAETVADLLPERPGRGRPRSGADRALAALLSSAEAQPDQDAAGTAGEDRTEGPGHGVPYRVFTRAHDRERRARDLVRPAVLHEYRDRLDALLAERPVNRSRLARRLRTLVARPVPDGWEYGTEAGQVDGRRLPTMITSPDERRIFRAVHEIPQADAHVTFLLDCSGSMKRHAGFTASVTDTFARALDEIDVPCSVLGFSTGAHHGGSSRRDWVRAGRPRHPGRLNDRLHIVFKDGDTPWRRARRDIAALFKVDLFREGLDGEALEWAAARTGAAPARRQVVFVVSDGGPSDGATRAANPEGYLDRHLGAAVSAAERKGVEVHGLGLGLDLSPYYRRSRLLDPAAAPTTAVLEDIAGLLAR